MTFAAAVATMLAATSLGSIISGWGWVWPVAGGIAAVAVGAWAARAVRAAAVAPLAATALVFLFVTAIDASSKAVLGFVPTGGAMQTLGRLVRDGFSDISHRAPPVPARPGLVLIAVIGVAAAALVVDLFTVTIGRPALAGLPLLALFALPASLARHGVGWWRFALAGIGWLLLLYADGRDRLSGWGQLLTRDDRSAAASSPLASVGRRIALASLAVASVVPLVIPGVSAHAFGRGGGGGNGDGPATVTTINPIVKIRDELRQSRPTTVLTVHTNDASPDYLRLTALDTFDGNQWTLSPISASPQAAVRHGLPSPEGVADVSLTTVQDRIQIDGLAVHWLPVPYAPLSVAVSGDWRYDQASQTIFSARTDTRGLNYTVTDAHLQPTAAQLRAATPATDMSRYLQLPKDLPGAVRRIAARVTRNAHTAYDKALALQNYFRSPPFVYDESVGQGNGDSAILAFLRSHHGFCEQYAATMAVMARALHIPARVAVGFTPGLRTRADTYVVSTRDAHAWPELYFTGIGWLRFEPTPRADGQAQIPTYAAPATGGGTTPTQGNDPSTTPTHATGPLGVANKLAQRDGTVASGPSARAHHGHATLIALWLALGVIGFVLLCWPGVSRVVRRARRWSNARDPIALSRAAWLDLADEATDAGRPLVAGDTPRRTANRLGAITSLSSAGSTALARLARCEERARYGRTGPQVTREELHTDLAAVRADLWRGTPVRRAVARCFPRSSMRRMLRTVDVVPAAVERLDGLLSGAGEWVRVRLRLSRAG